MKTNKSKAISVILVLIYAFGVFCLIYCAVPFIAHDTTVNNPDAMLPMERWDGAGFCLTLGFLPLLAASILVYIFARKNNGQGRGTQALRLLIFIPPVICLCLAAQYLIFSFS